MMNTRSTRGENREAGVALVAVVLILALLMGLAAALTTSVTMDTGLRGAFQRTTTGFYAAESGLNRGMGNYRNIFLAFRVPTAADYQTNSFILGSRTVNYHLTPANPDTSGNAIPEDVTIPVGQLFGGLNARQYTYIADSEAVFKGETEADVAAEFNAGYIPLFQFVAFYANDLEILPGPVMHLHGRVHTNGNLYLNSESHLYVEDDPSIGIDMVQISAKGDIYRGRKNASKCNGTVTIDMLRDADSNGNLDPRDLNCTGVGTRKVPPSELAAWKGSIVSQIESISVPEPDIVAKGSGIFWEKADLRLVLRLDQLDTIVPPWPGCGTPCELYRIEVQDAGGNQDGARTALIRQFLNDAAYNSAFSSMPGTKPIFYTAVPTCTANTNANCYDPPFANDSRVYATNMLADFDYRRGGFFDQREQRWMQLLNINLHDLLDWNMRQSAGNRLFDPADTTEGGLVLYATVEGPASAGINNYGVRLFGSAALPFPAVPPGGDPTGVTVVSDQPAYVLGDYNSVPPKQPAAVIGDTINVMSSNYFNKPGSSCTNDCQSTLPLSSSERRPVTTTINAAFLGGVDETTPGKYNGGLENYPRFHEDWSRVHQTLNYRGSFVSLGTPRHASGSWKYGSPIYTAPTRNYDYDADFNLVRNLPPLTPRFVYVQQVLFTEDFE